MKEKNIISIKKYFILFLSFLLLSIFYFFYTQNNSCIYNILTKNKNIDYDTRNLKQLADKKENHNQLLFINQKIQSVEKSIQSLQQEKNSSNTIGFNIKISNAIEQESKYTQEITLVELSEKLLDTLSQQLKSNKNLETLTIAGLGNSSEYMILSRMLKDLQDVVVKYKLLLLDYTENYPDVKKIKQQIKQHKKIIKNTIKRIQSNMSTRKNILKKHLQKEQKMIKQLTSNQDTIIDLEFKLNANKKVYEYLLQKKIEIEIINRSL